MTTIIQAGPRRIARAIAAFALVVTCARPLMAQDIFPPTSPRFQDVIRLAQDGYPDSARNSIQRIIKGMSSADPAYAEALYTSASIPLSVNDARITFVQITREYSNSAWADKAYYRLALLDYINAVDAALASFDRIFSDYPNSPVIPSAALWGARAAFEKNDLPRGCDWLRKGIAKSGADVELRNKLEAAKSRCNVGVGVEVGPPLLTESLRVAPPPAGRATTPPPVITKPDTGKPPAKSGATADNFRVQVAAITSKAAITRTVNALKKAGYTVWQVKAGKTLVKVQAGPFATRDAATAKLVQLKKIAGGKPFVVVTP